jgi:hypothetical protein
LSFILLKRATLQIAASSELILIFFFVLNLSAGLCMSLNSADPTYSEIIYTLHMAKKLHRFGKIAKPSKIFTVKPNHFGRRRGRPRKE